MDQFKKEYNYKIEYANDLNSALRTSKHALIVTAWQNSKILEKTIEKLMCMIQIFHR